MEKKKAIGFYWTLPVTWRDGPSPDISDIEKAAKQSKTLAWQREAVQRWAKENGYEVILERAYLELQPDRVLPYVEDDLRDLAERARRTNASILFVDFSKEIGWRRHILLQNLAGSTEPFEAVSLYAAEAERFAQHFKGWRKKHTDWIASKKDKKDESGITIAPGLRTRTVTEATALKNEGLKYADVAAELNHRGLKTMTGKAWKAETLRKFLKKYS